MSHLITCESETQTELTGEDTSYGDTTRTVACW